MYVKCYTPLSFFFNSTLKSNVLVPCLVPPRQCVVNQFKVELNPKLRTLRTACRHCDAAVQGQLHHVCEKRNPGKLRG